MKVLPSALDPDRTDAESLELSVTTAPEQAMAFLEGPADSTSCQTPAC